MGIEISMSISIAARTETVWSLLIDPRTWKSWWPDCIEATSHDFRTLREGSKLEVVVQPKTSKASFFPVVDLMSEGKSLSLTSRGTFLQSTVAWYLQPIDAGTRVRVHGDFTGLATTLMRLTRRDDTFRFALHGNLRGLKRVGERLG